MNDLKIKERLRVHAPLVLITTAIALLTFVVYLPALRNGFVNYDDNLYITMNQSITHLDFSFLRWAFTTFQVYNWQPFTWISYALDYAVWGKDPFGYHLTNSILHTANTVLVMLLASSLYSAARRTAGLGTHPRAPMLITLGIAGILFGVHPLHVESVAWLGERKDVLYAFFYLLALLSYLSYASAQSRSRRIGYYAACLMLFACSVMSKAMAVTLPVMLLLLDLFPLRRLAGGKQAVLRVLVLEKAPFFAVSAVGALLAYSAQYLGGAVKSFEAITLGERFIAAARALSFYLEKFVIPQGLAPFYPTFLPITLELRDLLVLSVFGVIASSCLWTFRRSWFLVVLWASYGVMLLPVLGIVKAGTQSAADRYVYLAIVGPCILAGLGVAFVSESLTRKFSRASGVLFAFFTGLLLCALLIPVTVRQIDVWKDDVSLWSREVEVYPYTVPIGYAWRADAFARRGMTTQAISDLTIAVQIDPENSDAYYKRGKLFYVSGSLRSAIDDFDRALAINPGFSDARYYKQVAEENLR